MEKVMLRQCYLQSIRFFAANYLSAKRSIIIYQHELSQQVILVATVPLDLLVSLTLYLQLQAVSNQKL